MAIPVINPSGITLPRTEAVDIAAAATIEFAPQNAATATSLEFIRQINTNQWVIRYNLDVQPHYIQMEVEIELPLFFYLDVTGYGAQSWHRKFINTYTYDTHGYNYTTQNIFPNQSPTITTGHIATSFFKAFWRRGISATLSVLGPYNAWAQGFTPNNGYSGVSQSDTCDDFSIPSRILVKYGYLQPGPVLTDASTGEIVTNDGLIVVQG